MNYECYLGPAKSPVVFTEKLKSERGGPNDKTFNLQQYVNVAFVSGAKDRLYQLSGIEFTSKTWTIYSPNGSGLCLPEAVFSNLYFLNSRSHLNFYDRIYNKTFVEIFVEGLILYFRDGMWECENGAITQRWKESYHRNGEKAIVFDLNENDDLLHIFFENDKFIYFIDNPSSDARPINNTLSKKDFVDFLMNILFVKPYLQNNMDSQVASILARALKINICQIAPPPINDNSLFKSWFFGYKGEFNTIIDGFTDMTENNSMIILNESKNHYKFLDNTDRKQTLSKIREINLICKSKVPEVNLRENIGAMEDPIQSIKGSLSPEIDPISLINMGFAENDAKRALHIFKGNVEQAITYLVSEKDSFAGVPKDKSSPDFAPKKSTLKEDLQTLIDMGFTKEMVTNALSANENVTPQNTINFHDEMANFNEKLLELINDDEKIEKTIVNFFNILQDNVPIQNETYKDSGYYITKIDGNTESGVSEELGNDILTFYKYSKTTISYDKEYQIQGSLKDVSGNDVPLFFIVDNEKYKMVKRDKSLETNSEIDPRALDYLNKRLQVIKGDLKNHSEYKKNKDRFKDNIAHGQIAHGQDKKKDEQNKNEQNELLDLEKEEKTINDILKSGKGIEEYLRERLIAIDRDIFIKNDTKPNKNPETNKESIDNLEKEKKNIQEILGEDTLAELERRMNNL